MGKILSVLTNSVFWEHTDNGLGDYVLFRLNDDWLFVPYEWSGPQQLLRICGCYPTGNLSDTSTEQESSTIGVRTRYHVMTEVIG